MPITLLSTAERIHAHYRNGYKALLDDVFEALTPLEELAQVVGAPLEAFLADPPAAFPEYDPRFAHVVISGAAEARSALPEIAQRIQTIREASHRREVHVADIASRSRVGAVIGATPRAQRPTDDAEERDRARAALLEQLRSEYDAKFARERAALLATVAEEARKLESEMAKRMDAIVEREHTLQKRALVLEKDAERLAKMEAHIQERQQLVARVEQGLQAQKTSLQREIEEAQTRHKERMRSARDELAQLRGQRTEMEEKYASERAQREAQIEALEAHLVRIRTELADAVSNKGQIDRDVAEYQHLLGQHQQQASLLREENARIAREAGMDAERIEYVMGHKDDLVLQTVTALASAVPSSAPVSTRSGTERTGDSEANSPYGSFGAAVVGQYQRSHQESVLLSNENFHDPRENLAQYFTATEMMQFAPPGAQAVAMPPADPTTTVVHPAQWHRQSLLPQEMTTTGPHTAESLATTPIKVVATLPPTYPTAASAPRAFVEPETKRQDPGFQVPAAYPADLNKADVPAADWAKEALLSRFLAVVATTNPDMVFPSLLPKPTVVDLFGVQNHPYDNRGRFTQDWGRDKLTREEIRQYNAEMGFAAP